MTSQNAPSQKALSERVLVMKNAAATQAPLRPAFCTIDEWKRLTGLGRRATYDLLGLGHLRAIKRGSRTLIDVDHGLAYLRSLPAAKIRAPKRAKVETA
jgi:hypothetical protein